MRPLVYVAFALSFLMARLLIVPTPVGQLSTFRISILFVFFGLVVTWIRGRKLVVGSGRRLVYFFVFWLAWALISVYWAEDFTGWLRAVYFIGSGVVAIIAMFATMTERRHLLNLFGIATIAFGAMGLLGAYEVVTGHYPFLTGETNLEVYAAQDLPVAWAGNVNDFGLAMLFAIPSAYVSFMNSKNVAWRVVCAGVIALSAVLCVATSSRGTLLGLMVLFGAYLLLNLRRSGVVLAVLTAVVLVALAVPGVLQSFILRLGQVLQFNFDGAGGSDLERQNLIRNGFVFLQDTLGFGTGAGNIEYWMAQNPPYPTYGILNIHNWWMEILVAYGVFIFAAYLLSYWSLIRRFFTGWRRRHDRFTTSVSEAMLCCLLSFVISAVSSSSNIMKEWLWCYFGLFILSYRAVGATLGKAVGLVSATEPGEGMQMCSSSQEGPVTTASLGGAK